MDERQKQMIEESCRKWGTSIQGWDSNEDGDEFADLGKAAAQEDGEFWTAGETGQLIAQVVGAPEYHNERVAFYFIPEGMDVGDEATPDTLDLI